MASTARCPSCVEFTAMTTSHRVVATLVASRQREPLPAMPIENGRAALTTPDVDAVVRDLRWHVVIDRLVEICAAGRTRNWRTKRRRL